MKSFIINNWYKMTIGFSSVVFSLSLMIYALKSNTVKAENSQIRTSNQAQNGVHIVSVDKNIYEVKWNNFSKKYDVEHVTTVR